MRKIISDIAIFFLNTLPRITSFLQSQPNDPETGTQHHRRPPSPPPSTTVEMLMQWEKMMVTFCLASAIAIATVFVQIETKLSLMFRFLSVALMVCFSFTASAKLIKHQRVSEILYCFGGFGFVTTFFVAIVIPYALHFQIMTLAVYLIFLSLTLICSFS